MSTIRIGAVSLDCADPGPLGAFWAGLLDGEVAFASEEIVVVKLDRFLLTAMRVPDWTPPTWPSGPVAKQGHLDLVVDDLAEAERRAISLGATRAETQPAPDSYIVLIDPAGHPFCLSASIPE